MLNLKPLQSRYEFGGPGMEIAQRWFLHFVNALDLADQEFRIADHFECPVLVLDGIFERADQRLVFGNIVGLLPQVLAETRDPIALAIVDYDAVTCRPVIAARATVGVRDEIGFRSSLHCDHLPAASRVASRAGRLAAKIFSCA